MSRQRREQQTLREPQQLDNSDLVIVEPAKVGTTCASCKHFHDEQRNPDNLGQRTGECRALPPPATVHLTPQRQAIIVRADTFARIDATMAACGLYQTRAKEEAPSAPGT